jgi:DNA-binding NtrC family response regulator
MRVGTAWRVEEKAMAAIETPVAPAFDAVETDSDSLVRPLEPRAQILSVSECRTDHTALRRIIDNTQWRLATADSRREALQKLCSIETFVVFCECTLPDGTWKDVLKLTSELEKPPLFIVTSRQANEALWSEVLSLGGYDVLSKPLVEDQVRRVLASVWTNRAHPSRTRVLRAAL